MLGLILIADITYLFSVRLASLRWHELYLGLFTELGKLYNNAKRNVAKDSTYKLRVNL